MMTPAVGDIVSVTGISTAVPAAGPMPGSTPTSIPSTQPITANIRLAGCITVQAPWIRRCQVSISDAEKADGQRHAEHVHEQLVGSKARQQRQYRREDQAALA